MQVTPKTRVIKAASDLASALKGAVSRNSKMAQVLQKFSKLFTKIATAKSELAKAKEQQSNLQNHPNAHQAVPLPRVAKRPSTPASPLPRVPIDTTEANCQVTILPTQTVERGMPRQRTHGQLPRRQNYISQDKDDDEPNHRYNTRSQTTSIIQEAMLARINITKPIFEISAAKLATRKFPLIWLCKMANSVLSKQSELLEYCHLIANPKTRATWTHSYGNNLGWLAQGILGRVTGTDTISFIPKDKVLRARAKKDVTYGLITCLIRPEKTNEPNQARLIAGGDKVHYPFEAGTPTAILLTVKLLKQHDLHTRGKIPNNGHQKFLPMYSHEEVQVHAIKTLQHARRRHCTLPPARHCNVQQVCLVQNPPRHVRAPASGDHCTGTIGKKTEGTWLHPE
jgi:hypothetical protein